MCWFIVEVFTVTGNNVGAVFKGKNFAFCSLLYSRVTQDVVHFLLAQNQLSLIYVVIFGAIFILH